MLLKLMRLARTFRPATTFMRLPYLKWVQSSTFEEHAIIRDKARVQPRHAQEFLDVVPNKWKRKGKKTHNLTWVRKSNEGTSKEAKEKTYKVPLLGHLCYVSSI